jgi:hypothetical protein
MWYAFPIAEIAALIFAMCFFAVLRKKQLNAME